MSNRPKSNFERMLQLVEVVFAMRDDPEQLQVDEKVIEKLQRIHPATLTEMDEGEGPCIWLLLIPTSLSTMHAFLQKQIAEQELFNRAIVEKNYEAIYLCSASTLPEYRGKGITLNLSVNAIVSLQSSFPIKDLFVWPFTPEGEKLAEKIASKTGLTLLKRNCEH